MTLLRSSLLILSFAFFGSPIAIAAQPGRTTQHLTCQKDTQGLMCTIDETQEAVLLKDADQSAMSQTAHNITSEQLKQVSDGLIGLMFVGLPIALILAVILHDKQNIDRTKRLEKLERLWHQS